MGKVELLQLLTEAIKQNRHPQLNRKEANVIVEMQTIALGLDKLNFICQTY